MENCKIIAETHLLNQNPLYAFNFPISLLIGILFFGISKACNWSSNSYINQILIPIVAFLCSMVFIDVISRLMISKSAKEELISQCMSRENFKNHKKEHKKETMKGNLINSDLMYKNINDESESEMTEQFKNMLILEPNVEEDHNIIEESIKVKENIEVPYNDDMFITQMSLDSVKYGESKCIEPSNCFSLCSGSGPNINPCNLINAIPGPQWLPQSAESVQNRLKNNDYTAGKCNFK